jgi:hypothetical protein
MDRVGFEPATLTHHPPRTGVLFLPPIKGGAAIEGDLRPESHLIHHFFLHPRSLGGFLSNNSTQ